MGPFSDTAGAAAFWIFLAFAAVAGNLVPIMKNRETQKTIRALTERGGDMDPKILESLLNRTYDRERAVGGILLGGYMSMAGGFGVAAIGAGVSLQAGEPIYTIFGAAILIELCGLALMLYARAALRSIKREGKDAGR